MADQPIVLTLEPATLPDDAVEVGRIGEAWGIKGWFKVVPHSASPEALFSSKRWFLQPPETDTAQARQRQPKPFTAFSGTVRVAIVGAKEHSDSIVAQARDVPDRNAAEALKGARIFVPRSSFPTPDEGEFYWVDLIGLSVINREGVDLGVVKDLLSTGPQTVLVIEAPALDASAKPIERMIPFVDAYVDHVDLPGRRITVDWQLDY